MLPPLQRLGGGAEIELIADERVVQAWRFSEWEAGCYSLVRFTLSGKGGGRRLSSTTPPTRGALTSTCPQTGSLSTLLHVAYFSVTE